MASYVVMEPPESGGEKTDRAKFVRDGFVFPALVVPVFWMLWHRMWLEAGLVFLAAAILGAAGERTDFSSLAVVLSIGLAVFTGFEGAGLRIASLRRKGWIDAGVVEAQSVEDAEIRYAYGDEEVVVAETGPAPRPANALPAQPAAPTGPALGLMSYPGHR